MFLINTSSCYALAAALLFYLPSRFVFLTKYIEHSSVAIGFMYINLVYITASQKRVIYMSSLAFRSRSISNLSKGKYTAASCKFFNTVGLKATVQHFRKYDKLPFLPKVGEEN